MCADDFYEKLLNSVYLYQSEGTVVICGDLNSRIGIRSDYIDGVDKEKY